MAVISASTFDSLRRYVNVRLQQGVPIVDSDWNEADDIRKFELRAFLLWYVGNGVPHGNDGFRIDGGLSNDFTIRWGGASTPVDGLTNVGRCLVQGLDVMITADMKYSDQLTVKDPTPSGVTSPNTLARLGLPAVAALTTPTTDGQVTAYLDVWERLVTPAEDPRLVVSGLDVETCARLKREWVVRVRPGARAPQAGDSDFDPTHNYYALAIITRRNGDPTIQPRDIQDLRERDLLVPPASLVQDALGVPIEQYRRQSGRPLISLRDAINSAMRGEVPGQVDQTFLSTPVGSDAITRAFTLDQSGGLVGVWSSIVAASTSQVFASRVDLANEAASRSVPPDQVSSGSSHDSSHAIVLPNGDLFVTYTATPAIVFKRAALGKLATATETQIAAGPSNTGIISFTGAPFAVLVGDFAVAFYFDFFATTTQLNFGSWAYRRYRHADGTFLDPVPQFAPELQQQPNMAFHAAPVGDGTMWITYVTAPRVGNQSLQVVRFRPATTSFDQASVFPTGTAEQITSPFVLPSRDGTVWVFWTQPSGIRFIRWTNGSWSATSVHPSTLPGDVQPSAVQTRDGAIWLCWVRANKVPIVTRFDPQQAIWGPPRTVRISTTDCSLPALLTPAATDQLLLSWVGTLAGSGRATYKRLVMTL